MYSFQVFKYDRDDSKVLNYLGQVSIWLLFLRWRVIIIALNEFVPYWYPSTIQLWWYICCDSHSVLYVVVLTVGLPLEALTEVGGGCKWTCWHLPKFCPCSYHQQSWKEKSKQCVRNNSYPIWSTQMLRSMAWEDSQPASLENKWKC